MKIKINYDFIDKIAEAKQGFSLKKCARKPTVLSLITTPTFFVIDIMANNNIYHTAAWILYSTSWYTLQGVLTAVLLKKETKEKAKKDLNSLVSRLRNNSIKVDEETVLSAYKYETQYNIKDSESIFPKIEEKKYIKIPIQDEYWGNRETPIVQEHIIGSDSYTLSIGQPEYKVYKLGVKTMLGK